ncbi:MULTISPECIES: type II toxin-antitoxin system Phd/YefM family antitoxin [Erwinia]|uniref:Antitoxin n=1 Tax=Erwinia pyrifoliae TaxID=79967 RepID=A0ABY5X637_ERWPY|nr:MULTISPECIES: type II toxin-antitoxin system Phd/YefM family antitoxin [Erwinia]ADP10094.1 Antitoxin module of toxin-antitoxin system [Erwinia sp. Ejp617]AUX73739.1 type II toxin-antitoxin system Phd/YefM family antitoxin [Erwinia pyrifoliae]MCA8875944.1 type II toxin-antitoxin system Phd/YefM family antitoxin [Erwinia pyrifoliae]MCT2387746.1 type II toxin-antitoxin system Phd/YefM family antitoxin [Erwinia pyrifoliae]MCU8586002.1 type II toxin-antitoxin system Phd/YefM family antitoxin [Er
MYSFAASEAKIQFGDVLVKAQREPVVITRNGKRSVVVVSAEDYAGMEAMKMACLREIVDEADNDIKDGNLVDGSEHFSKLR